MASTIVKIQGINDINIPFAMNSVNDVKANLLGDYPQIANMTHTQSTDPSGNIVHAFTQKDGTKN